MGIEKTSNHPANGAIPAGRAKSGRLWKAKQTERSSAQKRRGVLSHMAKSFEEKQRIREEKKAVQELENEMKEVKRQQKIEERLRREDKEKRKIANELKSSAYQNINPAKMKGMSKKQLRNIKKTSVNKFGQVELVDVYNKA
mmetsp:Transcript_23809/g.40537  ORF Transcript_23809/g.40537 Transcript_23809/m.40537 type:complete len:142 (+) Transcript_23809:31-456(+)